MGAEVRDKSTQSAEFLGLELETLNVAVDQLMQDYPNERSEEVGLLMETTAQRAHMRMSWQRWWSRRDLVQGYNNSCTNDPIPLIQPVEVLLNSRSDQRQKQKRSQKLLNLLTATMLGCCGAEWHLQQRGQTASTDFAPAARFGLVASVDRSQPDSQQNKTPRPKQPGATRNKTAMLIALLTALR